MVTFSFLLLLLVVVAVVIVPVIEVLFMDVVFVVGVFSFFCFVFFFLQSLSYDKYSLGLIPYKQTFANNKQSPLVTPTNIDTINKNKDEPSCRTTATIKTKSCIPVLSSSMTG